MNVRTTILGGLIAALGVALPGCSAFWPLSKDLEQAIATETESLTPSIADDDAVKAAALEAADGELGPPEDFALPDGATLDDYVRIALERNPRLQSMVRMLEALGMRVPQVTSLDDPMLTFVPPTDDMIETAAGQMDATLGISQTIPFPSKLAARGRIAEQVVRIGLENLRATRLQVISDVKRSYYTYYFSHVAITVTQEHQRLLEHIREIAGAKFESGTAPQQDVLRAEVQLYELSNDLLTLAQDRRTGMARLNVLMDRAVDAEIPPPLSFDPTAIEWRLDALMDRAVRASPELKAIQERVRRDLEAVHLSKLAYLPDFTVGGAYTWIGSGISPVGTGDDAWNLALGVRLPIWLHRIRAGILEKNADALASALQYRNRRNDVFFAIQDALVRVDTEFRRAVLFRDAILPRAHQTVEASESGYQAGDVDFLTWIDNWRRLLVLTLQYHEALSSLERNFATLEALVGGELDRSRGTESAPERDEDDTLPQ